MEQEAVFLEMLSEAQATKRCGGLVVVQVKRLAKRGTLPPKSVKIPGILVDLVVVEPKQWQTYLVEYSPSYAGELKMPLSDIPVLPLDARKIIARRAAMELFPGAICNLAPASRPYRQCGGRGRGPRRRLPDQRAGSHRRRAGLWRGCGRGPQLRGHRRPALPVRLHDGGGLDLAFLSFAEVDREGNVNVSRFGDRIVGPGGFINITRTPAPSSPPAPSPPENPISPGRVAPPASPATASMPSSLRRCVRSPIRAATAPRGVSEPSMSRSGRCSSSRNEASN